MICIPPDPLHCVTGAVETHELPEDVTIPVVKVGRSVKVGSSRLVEVVAEVVLLVDVLVASGVLHVADAS